MLLVIFLPLAAAVAAWHFYLSPEARQERAALAFIRAASLDDFEYRSYLQASGKWREKYQYTDAQFACITAVTREDFAKLLLPGTRDYLPRQELQSATRFLQSDLGEKYLNAIRYEVARTSPDIEFPLPVVSQEPAFDIDELEALFNWYRTPTGRKANELIAGTEQSGKAVVDFIDQHIKTCKRTAG